MNDTLKIILISAAMVTVGFALAWLFKPSPPARVETVTLIVPDTTRPALPVVVTKYRPDPAAVRRADSLANELLAARAEYMADSAAQAAAQAHLRDMLTEWSEVHAFVVQGPNLTVYGQAAHDVNVIDHVLSSNYTVDSVQSQTVVRYVETQTGLTWLEAGGIAGVVGAITYFVGKASK